MTQAKNNFEDLKKEFGLEYNYNSDKEFITIIDKLLLLYSRRVEKYHAKSDRNTDIFKARYINCRTTVDIAAEYGISSTAVDQISRKVRWHIYHMYVHEMWKPRTVVRVEPDPDLLRNWELDTRTYQALVRAGYERVSEVKEVMKKDPDKIKGIKNLGKKSFKALCDKLEEA